MNTQKQAEQSTPFDMETVERELDGAMTDLDSADWRLMADALRKILAYIIGPSGSVRRAAERKMIARRAIALAWTVDPSLISGRPSLTKVAQSMGLHKVLLSKHAARVSRIFGIQNPSQERHYPNENTISAH